LPDLFYINLLTDSVKIGGSATANNNITDLTVTKFN